MSILRKFNLFTIVFSAIFLTIILSLINVQVLNGYQAIETKLAQRNLERVKYANSQMLENLDTKVVDWAWWDDTYNYMKDKNTDYEESNLNVVGLSALKLHAILLFDKSRSLYAGRQLAVDTNQLVEVSPKLLENFVRNSPLFDVSDDLDKNVGLLSVDGHVYQYVLRPILTGEKIGPRTGYIVFVQDFETQIDSIGKSLQLPVSLDKDLTGIKSGETWLDLHDKKAVFGHVKIADYTGTVLGLLHFEMPREVSIVGRQNVVDIMVGLAVIFLVSAFANYILLRVLIINKLLLINNEVAKVSGTEGLVVRITELGGKDELSQLTKNINAMLLRLSASTELAQTGRANVRSYIDIVGVMVVVIDLDQKVVLINKKAAEVLGVTQEEAVGQNWFDVFVDETTREQTKTDFGKLMRGEIVGLENYENSVVTKNGKRLIAWHNALMKDDKGKIVATLSAGEDVTDQKLQELEKERKAKEIESLNDLMVGRELKMFEMKARLNKLKAEEGK